MWGPARDGVNSVDGWVGQERVEDVVSLCSVHPGLEWMYYCAAPVCRLGEWVEAYHHACGSDQGDSSHCGEVESVLVGE